MTFKTPPMVKTNLSPEEIIGVGNMPLFLEHYEIASRSTNGGEFPEKELNKKIGQEDRQHIADCYTDLIAHGYFPNGFDGSGGINWSICLKSKSYMEFEKGLEELKSKTIEELQTISRNGFRKLTK